MRRLLDCDFFLEHADPDGPQGEEQLRVFPGPRGIVIADARVRLGAGVRVRHGEAFETSTGIEFVFYREEDEAEQAGGEAAHALEMRFVVRGANYDPAGLYHLRPDPDALPSEIPAPP